MSRLKLQKMWKISNGVRFCKKYVPCPVLLCFACLRRQTGCFFKLCFTFWTSIEVIGVQATWGSGVIEGMHSGSW